MLKGTGKDWGRWIEILEKAGGRSLSHREMVLFVRRRYKLSSWWEQGVVTGFEMHIGRKVEGRNSRGEYSMTVSRTLPLGRAQLWGWMMSEAGMAVWLEPLSPFKVKKGAQFEVGGGIFGEVRTLKKPERVRFTWQDEDWEKPSVVQLFIIPRTAKKCILVFGHEKLTSDRLRLEMREHWQASIARCLDCFRSA